jgi:succinylarginine dihydrolase
MTLVLAAQTFVVLHRAEDLGAEQAVALRLERAVVDGLRLLYFADSDHERIISGEARADPDRVEMSRPVVVLA